MYNLSNLMHSAKSRARSDKTYSMRFARVDVHFY